MQSKELEVKEMSEAEFKAIKDSEFLKESEPKTEEAKRAKTREAVISEIPESEPEKKKRGRPVGARKKKKRTPVFTKEVGELYVTSLNSVLTVLDLEIIEGDFKKSYVDVSTKFFDKKFGEKIKDEETFMFITLTGALIASRSIEAQKKGLFEKFRERWQNRKILRFRKDVVQEK